jgi:protein SCO1/2
VATLALLVLSACASSDVGARSAASADVVVRHVDQDRSEAPGPASPSAERRAEAGTHGPADADAGSEPHAHPEALPSDAPLPGASLYHLDAAWTDHRGEPLHLADLRGHPVLVSMIYASCQTACPVLVRDLARTWEALPDGIREDARVLVVSFDPERDAPERLAAYVAASGLEHPAWRFAVGEAHATRALAALLGVRYRPAGDGMFSHTNLIAVLDADGRVAYRVEGLGMPVDGAVDAVAAGRSAER